ncbi:MAG: dTMP kinase [Xanthomonadales bacterium]|nr:dTMP kinase [Xanthomonadales bacterium]
MSAVFVSLEGSEGAGKSSLMRVIRKWLEDRGDTVVSCREPGGTPTGEAIRDILLDCNRSGILPLTELLLIFASRAQLLEQIIKPALAGGNSVICDRFVDASFAYQGGGRQQPLEQIKQLQQLVVAETMPKLTILLDVPVAMGLLRAQKTGAPDRIESEQREFFERVRKAYLRRARQYPERIVVVDASARQSAVRKQVLSILEQRL